MSKDFDVTKHRLTKDGKPRVAGSGGWYVPLKPGTANAPELVDAYMGKYSPKLPKPHKSDRMSKPVPTGMVTDQSVVSGELDMFGMVHKVEERTAKLVVSQDEIQKALAAVDTGDTVQYQYLDRKFNQWMLGSYNLTDLMNKIFAYCESKGAKVRLTHEALDCRTIHCINAFGAEVCINVKQMPATIEREIKRLCTIGKPYVWEDPGTDAPGEFRNGLMA